METIITTHVAASRKYQMRKVKHPYTVLSTSYNQREKMTCPQILKVNKNQIICSDWHWFHIQPSCTIKIYTYIYIYIHTHTSPERERQDRERERERESEREMNGTGPVIKKPGATQ